METTSSSSPKQAVTAPTVGSEQSSTTELSEPTKEMTQDEALAWANSRKRCDEEATILRCPECNHLLALYTPVQIAQPAPESTAEG